MQFDKPEHKQLVIEMIKNTNFSGQIAELVVELKQAVETAEIINDKTDSNNRRTFG